MHRLNISMDEQLYLKLKKMAGPRKISHFIAEAVMEKLHLREDALYQQYLEASQDLARKELEADWSDFPVHLHSNDFRCI